MMLKKSLFIALIITIATLFGVFFFSSSNNVLSNGQIIAMCLGALAWLALFFSSTAAKPNSSTPRSHQATSANHLTQTSNDDEGLSSHYASLLNTVQSELSEQIKATKAELAQVKSLMDGAIDNLVDSFISLEATTRIGQNLVKQMASSETDSKDDLNPFKDRQVKSAQLLHDTSTTLKKLIKDAKQNQAACASLTKENIADKAASKLISELQVSSGVLHKETQEIASKVATVIEENNNTMSMVANEMALTTTQIEQDVKLAVKSLQFQDMTTQLIVQCRERLNIMQEMLNAIDLFSKKSMPSDSAAELQTRLTMACDSLKQTGRVRMKQFNVDAGSVELFD
jgi:hypothetical protein